MKIAMSNVSLPSEDTSGVPFQTHYLANALVERGHGVTVFSFSPKPPDARYEVHQFQAPARASLPGLRKFYPFIFAWYLARTDFSAFDVLHTHGDNFLLWHKHPQVRTFHGSAYDEARAADKLTRKLFFHVIDVLERVGARFSDHNVGVSAVTKERIPLVETIIPCGVDLAAFRAGAKSSRPTILFVGTNDGRKRGRWLAEIFAREVAGHVPDAELVMVSDGNVGIEGVRCLGRVSLERLIELYAAAWVFCMPSTYEGFGVPYIEAMAAGTPVVATDNPGARDVLGGGAYGLLPSDAELGATLRELLLDAELRESFAERGRTRAQSFGWQAVAAQYESVYVAATMPRVSLSAGAESSG
jgi:glycosyltransferase involved in cell wall biosynthesis